MEQDFNYIELFINEIENAKSETNLNIAMFCFGLQIGTREVNNLLGIRNKMDQLPPILPNFLKDFSYDELRKIQNGTDSISEVADLPDGILFLINQLKVVIENNRNQWAFHYLFGLGLSSFNSKVITGSELQFFLMKFPQNFINTNIDQIERLSSSFCLDNYKIKIVTKHNDERIPILRNKY